MRKKSPLLFLLILLLLLSGCSAQSDQTVSQLIDPAKYGSIIPDHAPSESFPEKENSQVNTPPQVSDTKYTADMQWHLDGGYFVGEEFTFYVPSYWRDAFVMDVTESGEDTIYTRMFNFYYLEADTGIQVKLLRIDVSYATFVDEVGTLGKEELGRSTDGMYVYLRPSVSIRPPDTFHSGEDVYEICLALNSEKFDFQVVA